VAAHAAEGGFVGLQVAVEEVASSGVSVSPVRSTDSVWACVAKGVAGEWNVLAVDKLSGSSAGSQ
jgi:hypothetical protein